MATRNISCEEKQLVASQALETFQALGVPELIPQLTIAWKKSFTSRMGDAQYAPMTYKSQKLASPASLRFSEALWPRATAQDRYQTVVHEICHIVCSYKNGGSQPRKRNGRSNRIDSHGPQWKALMRQAGVNPDRTHKVDTTGLKRKSRKTVAAKCACETHMITPNMAQKITKGIYYRCKRCKKSLVLVRI